MSQNLSRPQVILFDWDNTLADTWHIIHKSLEKTFVIMGITPLTFEEVKRGDRGIHGSLRNSFPVIFGDRWEEARKHYFDSFLAVHLQEIAPLGDAKKTLDLIKELGIMMAVVSNKTGPYLREEVTQVGWDDYFHTIIGATDAKDDKPSHHPVELALRGADAEYNESQHQTEIWLVGDSKTDLQTAVAAGIVPVLFGNNEDAVSYLHEGKAKEHAHVEDHGQLIELLKGL
jgi:phosphoglycolate phosphatase